MLRTTALAGALALLAPAQARALTQAEEAGFALLATAVNVFYTPAKMVVAAVAVPVGGIAGALSGGDVRTAYAIWVPAMGGTYFLTNAHLEGKKPIDFWGYDYADRPAADTQGHRSVIYDTPPEGLYQ